ncbi:MAG: hypothetical protein IKJ44_00820 [Elusimicrobiaceae bacterium]|nr:hypothetical protein [Elusimicrobiaceae bacterium]
MFKIGQKVTKQNFTQAALWCNANGAHIEAQDGEYIIYANDAAAPSLQEQVADLESKYQMTRWQREIILAEGSGASAYCKAKAREIENLAAELRKGESV